MKTAHESIAEALRGVVAVLVTPYGPDGRVDEDGYAALSARCDAAGIHMLTALGNTAETFQLTAEERLAALRGVARGRSSALLLAGLVGPIDELLAASRVAADLGYEAVMPHEPADPFGDGEGLVRFYERVADASALPVVLYLRSERLNVEQIVRLGRHQNIVGGKFGRHDLATLAEVVPLTPECVWVNGLAESFVPAFAGLGIQGFTSGIAGARPDMALLVHGAARRGDLGALAEAVALIGPVERLRTAHHARHNVAVIKALLSLDDLQFGPVRPPHMELSSADRASLFEAVSRWPSAVLAG